MQKHIKQVEKRQANVGKQFKNKNIGKVEQRRNNRKNRRRRKKV